MPRSKLILLDVMVIRPLFILLLIIYHAFIIYQGGWSEPSGFAPVGAYWWVAKLSYSVMLPLFVFVSGYVFAFQVLVLRKPLSFKRVMIRKFNRLLLPCFVFGILYYFLFEYAGPGFSAFHFLYAIINGTGHLWFLPMLYWCFIGGAIVMKWKLYDHLAILVGGGFCR